MDRLSMLIIDSDKSSRVQLKELLEEASFIEIIGDSDNILAGYDILIEERPNIVFIDLSENINLALETIEKITRINKNIIIFASAENVSTDVVIKAMRAGAREFITKPFILEDLNNALSKARTMFIDDTNDKTGEVISVFSNKGGIGKTTIAVNLALQLAEVTGQRVCLVDLNLQLGDVTTFLDINPSFDIAYVVTHLSRLDESFLFSSLEKYQDKELYVLADPPYIEQAEEISADDITSIIGFLKKMFAYVVIDTSSSFDVKTLTCLDLSDMVLLISMINLPAIRNCQRCMDLLTRLEYDEEKVKLIINRYLESEEISVEDVEDALGHEVFWKLPNNYFAAISSINKGISISEADPDSNLNESFIQLAGKISGVNVLGNSSAESQSSLKFPGNFHLAGIVDKLRDLKLIPTKQ